MQGRTHTVRLAAKTPVWVDAVGSWGESWLLLPNQERRLVEKQLEKVSL